MTHKPLFNRFHKRSLWCLHFFYLLHQKIPPTTSHPQGPQRNTTWEVNSSLLVEHTAGGVSQARHWSSDAGPAARQSAALSKTGAGLKGLTRALFSPRGVESDRECTWSSISPNLTDVCRSAENISALQCDFTDVFFLQSKRIQHFGTSLQLQISEDQSSFEI